MNLLNDAFAAIYENRFFGIFDAKYQPIFRKLFDEGGYTSMGLIFILIPIGLMALFYFLWKYPYGKYWHWLIWLGISTIVVATSTIGFANSLLAVYLTDSETVDFTSSIITRYAIINAVLGVIVAFLISLLFKRLSKIQKHLPF